MIKVKVEVASNEELVRSGAAAREIKVLSSLRKREGHIDLQLNPSIPSQFSALCSYRKFRKVQY